jgi:hypothetical protein
MANKTTGTTPHNKVTEKQYDKLKRLKRTIELPSMLWCADVWSKVALRLAYCTHNRVKHNTTMLTGFQLAGLHPDKTQTLLSQTIDNGLVAQVGINKDGSKLYDMTNKGVKFVLAITSCSETTTRNDFDTLYPFASNLHNNRGHRFKGGY